MTRLALLRHGPTAWNRTGRIQGRTDIPLDVTAEDQLGRLSLPEPWEDATLVSSPLSRARRTAQLVAGREPEIEPALIEMDWGQWEGSEGAALKADPTSGFRDIDHWGWHFRPPGGETPAELRDRLLPWASGLDRDTLAVCHIGVMRVLLATATGWAFDGPCPFSIKRNRLYVIDCAGPSWRLAATPLRLKGTAP